MGADRRRAYTQSSGPGNCSHPDNPKLPDDIYYLRLFRYRKVVIKGQTQQAIAGSLGDRALALAAASLDTHCGKMQRKIMENAEDAVLVQFPDERLPRFQRRHN